METGTVHALARVWKPEQAPPGSPEPVQEPRLLSIDLIAANWPVWVPPAAEDVQAWAAEAGEGREEPVGADDPHVGFASDYLVLRHGRRILLQDKTDRLHAPADLFAPYAGRWLRCLALPLELPEDDR